MVTCSVFGKNTLLEAVMCTVTCGVTWSNVSFFKCELCLGLNNRMLAMMNEQQVSRPSRTILPTLANIFFGSPLP